MRRVARRRTCRRIVGADRLSLNIMSNFLLDTGLLLGFCRSAPWALQARTVHGLGEPEATVFTSIVCHGELLSLAEKFGWGRDRRTRLREVLATMPVIDINDELILEAYAQIDTWTHGKSVIFPDSTPPPKPAIPMKQNDLWIAVTAHVSGAVLLSTDRDFAHLNDVWLKFVYVDQTQMTTNH